MVYDHIWNPNIERYDDTINSVNFVRLKIHTGFNKNCPVMITLFPSNDCEQRNILIAGLVNQNIIISNAKKLNMNLDVQKLLSSINKTVSDYKRHISAVCKRDKINSI